MQRLEVSCAVRRIYRLVRRQRVNVCSGKEPSVSLAADTATDLQQISRCCHIYLQPHTLYTDFSSSFHLPLNKVQLVKMGHTMLPFATERSMVLVAYVANIETLQFIPSFNQCGRDCNSILVYTFCRNCDNFRLRNIIFTCLAVHIL